MNCREFEVYVADWVSGRLPEEQSTRMEAHCAACSSCARAAVEEQDMRARWRALSMPSEPRNLWPQISARLQPAHRAPRFAFARRFAFGMSVAAAGAACVALWMLNPFALPSRTTSIQTGKGEVDESRVVLMVASMQRLPDPDRDLDDEPYSYEGTLSSTPSGGQER